jgi:hypothetical protein
MLQIEQLELQQESLKKPSGDFTQIKRIVEEGVDYAVHTYGNPAYGYWGYQVVFYETREDGEYFKSVGYGVEAESRTYDWQKIDGPH